MVIIAGRWLEVPAFHRNVRFRPIADIRGLAHFHRVRLPRTTLQEFRQAIDDAHPRWAKIYIWAVGVPAWLYMAYRVFTADKFEIGSLDKVAAAAFASAVLVSIFILFRAFWRNDL